MAGLSSALAFPLDSLALPFFGIGMKTDLFQSGALTSESSALGLLSTVTQVAHCTTLGDPSFTDYFVDVAPGIVQGYSPSVRKDLMEVGVSLAGVWG